MAPMTSRGSGRGCPTSPKPRDSWASAGGGREVVERHAPQGGSGEVTRDPRRHLAYLAASTAATGTCAATAGDVVVNAPFADERLEFSERGSGVGAVEASEGHHR